MAQLPSKIRIRIGQFPGETSQLPHANLPNTLKRWQVSSAKKDRGCYKYVCLTFLQ